MQAYCYHADFILVIGVEIIVTSDIPLMFREDAIGKFNICVIVTNLPTEGLSCDQLVILETENGTAG